MSNPKSQYNVQAFSIFPLFLSKKFGPPLAQDLQIWCPQFQRIILMFHKLLPIQ